MRIHWCQHVPFEGLESIEDWAVASLHPLTVTRFFQKDPLPRVDEFDWLFVMGGPMGVHEEESFPWLKEEKKLIEEAIRNNKLVLGICLGAQLIADVLGASVNPNRHKEIGWFHVDLTPEAARIPAFAGLPPRFDAFHWHGDIFDLPAGAIHIARSAACDNQGFVYGGNVLALQFHLETTPSGAAALIEECASDLAPGTYVQTPESILAITMRFREANKKLHILLDRVSQLGLAASPEP